MRPWQTWLAFAVSLALLLAVMGWVSLTVVRLDEESAEARRVAAFEEDIRLALWRMDSVVAPIIGRENVRPALHYSASSPAGLGQGMRARVGNDVRAELPSPLHWSTPRHVRVHFQYHPDGRLTSPQASELAASGYGNDGAATTAGALVAELGRRVSHEALAEALPGGPPLLEGAPPQPAQQQKQAQVPNRKLRNPQAQQALNVAEFQARQMVTVSNAWNSEQALPPQPQQALRPGNRILGQAILRPLWFDDTLVLARRMIVDGEEYIQGCWVDWEGLGTELIAGISDLLPGASLAPVSDDRQDDTVGRRLASLPVMLTPGDPPPGPAAGLSPIQLSLLVAWVCLLLAAAAVSVLLRGAMALSERRGAFVSAVTHELRTPLTTLRMYAEMLATGMVEGEDKRTHYLETLHAQSERLAHLVENVLAYSRLERGRSGGTVEQVALPVLIDRVRRPLEEQARQAGASLELTTSEAAQSAAVQADLSAVERILFNLVDNAGKYAAGAGTPPLISLEVERKGDELCLRVRDNGPGVPQSIRPRLFRPFSKSAIEAAHSAPGVGLGLALSRRLARQMGGDLRFDDSVDQGAAFVLTLQVVP